MPIHITNDPEILGAAAATVAAATLRAALATQERATVVLACAPSQFHTLTHLLRSPGIAWERVICFHLDEYLGMEAGHPASFRRVLHERFLRHLPAQPVFHGIAGEATDPQAECRRLADLIQRQPIDLALIGIGENGHVAFNDPPADLCTREPYLIVTLDEACRQQQLGEGWFPTIAAVPQRALSMSPRQIMAARRLICSVPDMRKAEAIRGSLEGPVTDMVPASILRLHPDYHLFLDRAAASRLRYMDMP